MSKSRIIKSQKMKKPKRFPCKCCTNKKKPVRELNYFQSSSYNMWHSARGCKGYPSHTALPPCRVVHTARSCMKVTGDECTERAPAKSCISMTQ